MRYRALLVLLAVLLIPSWSLAKKQKTGQVDKGVFADSLFGYQLTVPSNWKLKTENEPSLVRATLQKTKLEPLPAGGSQGYYGNEDRPTPTITLFADTTSLSLKEFCDRLVAGKGKLPREKEYLMKLELLIQSKPEDQVKIKVGDVEGIKYTFSKSVFRQALDPSHRTFGQGTEVTIEESLLGHVIVFKKEGRVYVIQCFGERATFQFEDLEYWKLLESWKFI